MQWYVYFISVPAGVFLGQLALEFIKRPIAAALCLRKKAVERMLFFKGISPPKPRELAISFQDICAYDQAVRNLKEAQLIFADLGAQLLALSEGEPALRLLMTLFGLNIVRAGHELINLSQACAIVKNDSDEHRQEIDRAFQRAGTALTAPYRPSHHDLMKIRLEPIYLRGAGTHIRLSSGQ